MKKCLYCGKDNQDDAGFCQYCGKNIQSIVPIPKKRYSIKTFAILGIGLIVIMCCIGSYFSKSSNKSTTTPTIALASIKIVNTAAPISTAIPAKTPLIVFTATEIIVPTIAPSVTSAPTDTAIPFQTQTAQAKSDIATSTAQAKSDIATSTGQARSDNATSTAEAAPPTTFGDGTYAVGKDIAPGTYTVTVPDDSPDCYWERVSGFDGSFSEIIANNIVNAGVTTIVTIRATDAGFTSENCGIWTLK